MKDSVKLDSSATIVVAGHSTPRGVSMGTLTVRVTDAQGFLHDKLLPVIICRCLVVTYFQEGRWRLKE